MRHRGPRRTSHTQLVRLVRAVLQVLRQHVVEHVRLVAADSDAALIEVERTALRPVYWSAIGARLVGRWLDYCRFRSVLKRVRRGHSGRQSDVAEWTARHAAGDFPERRGARPFRTSSARWRRNVEPEGSRRGHFQPGANCRWRSSGQDVIYPR